MMNATRQMQRLRRRHANARHFSSQSSHLNIYLITDVWIDIVCWLPTLEITRMCATSSYFNTLLTNNSTNNKYNSRLNKYWEKSSKRLCSSIDPTYIPATNWYQFFLELTKFLLYNDYLSSPSDITKIRNIVICNRGSSKYYYFDSGTPVEQAAKADCVSMFDMLIGKKYDKQTVISDPTVIICDIQSCLRQAINSISINMFRHLINKYKNEIEVAVNSNAGIVSEIRLKSIMATCNEEIINTLINFANGKLITILSEQNSFQKNALFTMCCICPEILTPKQLSIYKNIDKRLTNIMMNLKLRLSKKTMSKLIHMWEDLDYNYQCRDVDGNTPLHCAVLKGDKCNGYFVDVIETLLRAAKDARNLYTHNIYSINNHNCSNIEKTVNINCAHIYKMMNQANHDDLTPLMIACGRKGSLAAVKLLLDMKGIDIFAKNRDGATAFHMAATSGNGEKIKYLYNYAKEKYGNRRNGMKLLNWYINGRLYMNEHLDTPYIRACACSARYKLDANYQVFNALIHVCKVDVTIKNWFNNCGIAYVGNLDLRNWLRKQETLISRSHT